MFYYVCVRCEAKFFSPRQVEPCPRCGMTLNSRERLTPPWQTHAKGSLDQKLRTTPRPNSVSQTEATSGPQLLIQVTPEEQGSE